MMALSGFMKLNFTSVVRRFSSCPRLLSSIDAKFDQAKVELNTLKNDPGNEAKLKIYALFKQATIGKNTTSKPSAFNFVGQAKWSAWNELGEMSQDEAKQGYIGVVKELRMAEGDQGDSTGSILETETDVRVHGAEGLVITTENKVTTLKMNRPEKLNAITREMYLAITAALNDAANDDATSLVLLTGTGDYYSSGNDLKNFDRITPANMKVESAKGAEILRQFVASFINFPKPLIAAVNGHTLGIMVTSLGLCDAVFASDKATFLTPFSKLGQSPEACSSYTFPKIMGYSRASRLMLFNEKMTAQEALDCGLVGKIFSHSTFEDDVQKEVKEMVELPLKSLVYTKRLIRGWEKDILHKANDAECDRLRERWTSEDCFKAVMAFMSKQSK